VKPRFFAAVVVASSFGAALALPPALDAQGAAGGSRPAPSAPAWGANWAGPALGRGASPAAGRGAAPAPANYPTYERPSSTYAPPKTADGQPDISGLYVAIPLPRNIETPLSPLANRVANRANSEFSYSINERPKLPEGAIARPAGVDPADGRIPLTPEALARRKEIIARQEQVEHLDGRVLCLAPGIPRSTVPAPVVGYQIFQKPGHVVIFYEQNHLYRTIPLDARPAPDPAIKKAMGVSRGHWEGNTLVVEVTNFTTNLENNWVIGAISAAPGIPAESLSTGHGIPHSDQYKVTERYTPIDANTIHYEATLEDPKVFTQPWTVAWYAFSRAPKDYVPVEYACFEGNAKNIMLMTNTDMSHIRVDVP
jgi:hypothetical protein